MNARLLTRKSLARNPLHLFAESIQLTQRGVQIRRDANAGEFFVKDRSGKDVMLAEEVAANCALIESLDLDIGDCA